MSLPYTFGTLPAGNTPASNLDANFTALGNIDYVPCTASGTNAITLTPVANTPTIASYGQLQGYSFIAAGTSTGAITISISPNGFLPAYKPSISGPLAAGAGDSVGAVYYVAVYDIALNGGSGGFHLINVLPVASSYVAYGNIYGLLPTSIAGANTTATMTVTSGQTTNGGNSVTITLVSSQPWAVSNGNAINGYQGGTTLPNSSTIHMFVCQGGSGVGTFASTSLTPTLPAGYTTYYRRIFSFKTTGAGAPIPYTAVETEGGSLLAWLGTQTLDVSSTTLGTARTLFPLNVPTGIKVQPIIRAETATATAGIILTSGDEVDVAPAAAGNWTVAPGNDLNTNTGTVLGGFFSGYITTDTSGQIGARAAAASTSLYVVTRGWKDWRRT